MPKQVNVLLDEELVDQLEETSIQESKSNGKKITVSDVIRHAVRLYYWEHPSDVVMNRFYEAIQRSNKVDPLRKIQIRRGDKQIDCELECYEVFFSFNQKHELRGMEANLYITTESDLRDVPHPSLFTTVLPNDLLHKAEPYEFRFSLTTSSSIEDVSRFTERYNSDPNEPLWKPCPGLGAFFKSEREKIISRKRTLIDCWNSYETMEVPSLTMRCRRFKKMNEGYIFNFYGNIN